MSAGICQPGTWLASSDKKDAAGFSSSAYLYYYQRSSIVNYDAQLLVRLNNHNILSISVRRSWVVMSEINAHVLCVCHNQL